MSNDWNSITDLDKWVISALTVIAIALVAAAVFRDNLSYLSYLTGIALLSLIYFGSRKH